MIRQIIAPMKLVKLGSKGLRYKFNSNPQLKKVFCLSNKMFFCSQNKQQKQQLSKQQKLKLFEQLMLQGTQQSLTKAAEMFVQAEELNQANQRQLRQLQQFSTTFPHHLHHLIQIETKLLENIKMQQEDNLLIEKRALKQIQDTSKFGVIKIGKQVIELADSLKKCKELAMQIYKDQKKELMSQVNSCQLLLDQIFAKYGIEQFDPTNQIYDPNTQQALFQVPSPDESKKNMVAVTTRTGYKIRGRLLRSAHVGVFR